ncbi:MAG: protoporphyrinogen oxidase [Candidatus Eisenbacteria bacterium]|nr:protoporphyrinogen oxidase [Candidatus Eisenbacteria bacterium]
MRTIVVGGGITGLTLGFRLREGGPAGCEVTVLEAGERPGGHATTLREDGFLVEGGPNGFLSREPGTLELARELGLGAKLIEARPEAKKRYIVRGGRLCAVPDSPPALLTSPALSPAGKLRLLLEPWAKRAPEGIEETVHQFAVRRIGAEAAEMLVDAAVAGISAGDSRALSAAAAFPLMLEMERDHGSLIRAMIARARAGMVSRIMSLEGGLGELAGALRERLGGALRTGARVARVARAPGGAGPDAPWRVTLADGTTLEAERLVLATPAWAAAALVRDLDPELARALETIRFAGVSLVALAYRAADVPRRLDGYGYLVSRGEKLSTLGVVWESSLFAGRAPQGMVLLRAFVGGERDPQAVELQEAEVVALARRELQRVLGVAAAPARVWTFRWPRAIAQYTLGQLDRVRQARALASRHPGLELVGTSYDGVSFNQAIAAARSLADRLNAADAAALARDGVPAGAATLAHGAAGAK